MKKKIFFTIIGLIALVGVIGGIKALQIGQMVAQGKNFSPPPETVTTARAAAASWESLIPSVGSLEAVQGVMVTAELTGKVTRIAFAPGKKVKAGDLLVTQDTSSEEARLRAAEAATALAKINFDRARGLLAQQAISKSEFDNADAQLKSAVAEADGIRTLIEKKTIRAPFSGRLGMRLVNLGQLLKEGTPIVTLQALDPIFVNFLLPQQEIARVRAGLRSGSRPTPFPVRPSKAGSPPSTRRSIPPPAISASRLPWTTPTSGSVPACSPMWPW